LKCVKHIKSGKIIHVSNEIAAEKVDTDKYDYCTKTEYKKQLKAEVFSKPEKRRKSKAKSKGGDTNTNV